MPYIPPEKRKQFREDIEALRDKIDNEGDLNYVITCLCKEYMNRFGERYATHNTLIGVLQCAQLELYRRKTARYEDGKIEENGDVY